MRRVLSSVVCAGFASLMTTACAFERSSNVLVPTSTDGASGTSTAGSGGGNAPAPGSTSTPSLIGTYVSSSAAPTLPDPKSCGNFQYQIASQTSSSIAGTFTGTCG